MYSPPDPAGYNRLVWEIVRQIPAGKVSTYGQIASMIPPPEGVDPDQYRRLGARWVGSAMRLTPAGEGIPWQRVINSAGEISLPRGSSGAEEQRALLEIEGVSFSESERIDFRQFGWEGPSADWLTAHSLHPPRPLAPRANDESSQPSLF